MRLALAALRTFIITFVGLVKAAHSALAQHCIQTALGLKLYYKAHEYFVTH